MNIWKALNALQTLGIVLTVVGDLVKNLGRAITGSNLETEKPSLDSEDEVRSQDPPAQGAMDEKPDESQTSFLFIGGTDAPPKE